MRKFIDIVFADGKDSTESLFVEVEDEHGRSVSIGEWVKRPDGYSVLRITPEAFEPEDPTPYCSSGHKDAASCDCGPIADNE